MPHTEKRGRVHTSTVTVAVVDLEAGQVDVAEEYSFRWFSGTGAGGQHRNKHQNCLELTHTPSGIKQVANGRCRTSNQEEATRLIQAKLAEHYRGQASSQLNGHRASQIGSGMRGDKRRTYRFQDDTVVDHETNKSTSCRNVMKGKFSDLW